MLHCDERSARLRMMCATCVVALSASGALAQSTDFEGLSEDFYGQTFTHDGITFQNAFSDGDQRSFSIDDATQVFQDWNATGWADGNVLGMGAYSGGPGNIAFSAIDHFEMTTGSIESFAEFTFIYILNDGRNDFSQNTMTLEAVLGGSVVHSEDYIPGNEIFDSGRSTYGATRFSLSGVDFDTVRLTMDGPANLGRVVGVFDNVTFVPAPGSLAILGLSGMACARRRR